MALPKIEDMKEEQLKAEIRKRMGDLDHVKKQKFAFISYSHFDSQRVYQQVLTWMRAHYNIYIDLDFERQSGEQNWTKLAKKALRSYNCHQVICFRSINYHYSYASLVELMIMSSDETKSRHSSSPLKIEPFLLDSPIPEDDEFPSEDCAQRYEQRYNKMRASMSNFASNNIKVRQILESGFDDWLSDMSSGMRRHLGYERYSGSKLLRELDHAFDDNAAQDFYAYISKLSKHWFISQDLNGNTKHIGTDMLILLKEAGVAVLSPHPELDAEEPAEQPVDEPEDQPVEKPADQSALDSALDMELFHRLRQVRARLAKEQHLPAYRIFWDSVLWSMVKKTPGSERELLQVNGVGPKKAQLYGKYFLEVLTNWKKEHTS